jgi:hypothetical protein
MASKGVGPGKAKPEKADDLKKGGNVLDAILRPKMASEGWSPPFETEINHF